MVGESRVHNRKTQIQQWVQYLILLCCITHLTHLLTTGLRRTKGESGKLAGCIRKIEDGRLAEIYNPYGVFRMYVCIAWMLRRWSGGLRAKGNRPAGASALNIRSLN